MAVSVLIALLSLGFGLLQMLSHPETSSSPLALAQAELAVPTSTTASLLSAATVGGSLQTLAPNPSAGPSQRAIQANVKVLQPDYTIAAGDTLVKIAQRYNTSVERIQAFNNLADPRALRIGARLIIPPPL